MRKRTVFSGIVMLLATSGCPFILDVNHDYHKATAGGEGGGGGTGGSCPGTQTLCSGICVDTKTDPKHCGRCQHNCWGSECREALCEPLTLVRTGSHPLSVAVDANIVYWTEENGDGQAAVMKLPLGGGGPTQLASMTLGHPADIVVDSTNVYWTEFLNGLVMKVPIMGGTAIPLASGQTKASGIAIDATSVYWTTATTDGTIMKAPIGGGTPTALFSHESSPESIAVSATSVFWTNYMSGTVRKLQGDSLGLIAANQSYPFGIIVDKANVYWTSHVVDGKVMKASISGGAPPEVYPFAADSIATDGSTLYGLQAGDKVVQRPLAGGEVTTLTLDTGNLFDHLCLHRIAVDATYVYWTNYEAGTVMQVAK